MDSSGIKKGLPVLVYHAVDDYVFGSAELFVDPQEFDRQMEYLYVNGYTTLTFKNIKEYYKYKNPILITFDDGYEDVYRYAFPVLKKYGFQATMFIIAKAVGHTGYLKQKEIMEMSGVFSFESHTLSHPQLDKKSIAEIEQECRESKVLIEKITSKPVNTLSFPYGRYDKNVLAIARKYYDYCVTTNYGNYLNSDSCHEISRIYITGSDTIDAFRKKIQKVRTCR